MALRDQQRSSGRGVEGFSEVLRYGDTQETETGDKDYLYYADISFTVVLSQSINTVEIILATS